VPKVPTYERQTKSAALPSVTREARETPESQGAGVARAKAAFGDALTQLGGTVADAGVRAFNAEFEARQAREDQIIYQGSERALADLEFLSTYGDQGFTKAKGLEAQDAGERVLAHFKEQGGMIVGMARNERQRAAIQRAVEARFATLREATGRWAEQQLTEYDTNEYKAYLTTTLNAGIAAAHGKDSTQALPRVQLELERGEKAIVDWAARHKEVGAAQRELQVQQFHTAMHVGVIGALLEQEKVGLARTYFEHAKDEITDEQAHARVVGLLKDATVRGVSQRVTDAIVAGGGTLADQRAKVKALSDDTVPLPGGVDAAGLDRALIREDVEQRFEQHHAREQRDKQDAEEKLVNEVYNIVDETHDLDEVRRRGLWEAVPGPVKNAVRNYLDALVAGTPIETDWDIYYEQIDLAARDPATFIDPTKNNLMALRDKLDNARFKELVDLRARYVAGQIEDAGKQARGLRGAADVVEETFRQHGIDTSNTRANRANYERFLRFRKLVDDKVRFLGGLDKVGPDQVQQIADDLLIEVTLPHPAGGMLGGLFPDWWNRNETKPAFEVTPADLADISAADRATIINGLRQRGLPVTDANIVQAYIRAKGTRK
jgi:hypothetical protein